MNGVAKQLMLIKHLHPKEHEGHHGNAKAYYYQFKKHKGL